MAHNVAEMEAFYADPNFDMTTGLLMWQQLEEELSVVKDLEMMARKAIFKKSFPIWKVGVNNYPLAAGYILKGTGKINYRVDKEMFPQVREGLASMGAAPLDDYLRVSYSLAEGPYNAILKDEQQNATVGTVLRQMITSSEGAPTLEIVKSKKG
jgi:hypothetical protein